VCSSDLYLFLKSKSLGIQIKEIPSPGKILRALKDSGWALGLVVVIFGGIYTGIFTVTESAAIAAIYALFVEVVIYRNIKIKEIPQIAISAAITTAGGAYLGTLGPSYFVTFITRTHRSNGTLGSYKFNISTDRCVWIGCPGPLWWPVGGLWIEDLFPKSKGSIKGTKTLKGTLNMDPAGLPYMEIVGVLVYGVQEDNQEGTLVAASPVPAP